MAGFEAPIHVFQLEFDHYDGLEVKARGVQFGKLLELTDQLDALKGELENFAPVKGLVDTFTASLKSWNITSEGEPVPCNRAGFDSLDFTFALEIVSAWAEAISGKASDSTVGKSNGGSQSEEPPILMETL